MFEVIGSIICRKDEIKDFDGHQDSKSLSLLSIYEGIQEDDEDDEEVEIEDHEIQEENGIS